MHPEWRPAKKTKTKGRNNWKYFAYCFGNIDSVVVVSRAKKIIEILIERDRVSETKKEMWSKNGDMGSSSGSKSSRQKSNSDKFISNILSVVH